MLTPRWLTLASYKDPDQYNRWEKRWWLGNKHRDLLSNASWDHSARGFCTGRQTVSQERGALGGMPPRSRHNLKWFAVGSVLRSRWSPERCPFVVLGDATEEGW